MPKYVIEREIPYIADDERAIHEHAELSGFPANRVSRVAAVLDPASAGT